MLGDGAFPLSLGLMKPFSQAELRGRPDLRHFNYILSSNRMLVECAFGLLKERFRCLLQSLPFKYVENSVVIVRTCLLLHNYLIGNNDVQEDSEVEIQDQEEDQEEAEVTPLLTPSN